MHIIALEVENFKRLTAVSLKLDGGNLIIGGENESGKSSLLDAIWVALGGADVMKDLKISQPIRTGAEGARITLDLGDLIISRNWTANDKSYLKVSTREGANYPSPQAMLDKLMGKLFDPFEFSKMKEDKQKEILLSLVNIDLDLNKWALDRKALYEGRTDVNREVTRLDNTLKSMAPVDAPDEEVKSETIFNEMKEAQKVKEANDQKRRELQELGNEYKRKSAEYETARKDWDAIEEQINALKQKQEELFEKGKKLSAEISEMEQKGKEMKVAVEQLKDPDLSIFQTRLEEVEKVNANVRAKKERAKLEGQRDAEKKKSDDLTAKINAMDKQKEDAIKAAKFPVEGLGFDDAGVTFKGIPFGQCSSEERIRVGMAIAMAMNPKVKIIRIADGSLLDEKNFRLIQEMAADKGYQLLIEKVGNPGEMGIIIEDGTVKEAAAA